MSQPRPTTRAPFALLLALLLGCAGAIEWSASRRAQGQLLAATQLTNSGLYGEEIGAFPTIDGPTERAFRWTEPEATIRIWPGLPATGEARLTYFTVVATGALSVRAGDAPAVSIPYQPQLRVLHLLIEPRHRQIRLAQSTPLDDGGRQLGMIVAESRWMSLAPPTIDAVSHLLPGLPFTLMALWSLLLLLRAERRWTSVITILVLAGAATLSQRRPWELRAMQAALQWSIGGAILGVTAARLWRWRKETTALVVIWTICTMVLLRPIVHVDGLGYYAYVRSLLIDGDLHFANEFDPAQSPFARSAAQAAGRTTTGYVPNPWSVGPAIVWTPFWLLAHAITYIGRALGFDWQADGYALPYVALIGLASALASLGTLLGSTAIAWRWCRSTAATTAAIALYLGSNLVYYAQFEGSFAHSFSAASVTLMLLLALRLNDAPTARRWALLGASAGAMLLIYWITGLLLLIPAGLIVGMVWRQARARDWPGLQRTALGMIVALICAISVFFPQMLVWKILYGNWLTVPQGGSFISPQHSQLIPMLIGPLYGLAWWTPAYALSLAGALLFAWRCPWPGLLIVLGIAGYLFYNSILPDWHGSGAFGLRRLTALAPLLTVGLATLFERLMRWRYAPAALTGLLAGWTMPLMARYLVFQVPHEPTVLAGLPLAAILWGPRDDQLAALIAMVRGSLVGVFVRTGSAEIGLVLLAGACVVLLTGVAWRMTRRETAGG